MAFNDTEKAKIRMWLGYPNQFRYKNTRLESSFDSVDADGETLVRSYIRKIEAAEAEFPDAFSQANLARVDEIEWHPSSGGVLSPAASKLREARTWAARIGVILGVPFFSDAFSDAGYPGDAFTELGQMGPGGGGRGGPIRLG